MTKKVFKSLPRLLNIKKICWVTLYTLRYNGMNDYYHHPKEVIINGEYINFVMKDYYIWKDPINFPNKPTIYPIYKVSIHRKDIQCIDFN